MGHLPSKYRLGKVGGGIQENNEGYCHYLDFPSNGWQGPIAEDTVHIGHRTWRNQARTEVETSSLLSSFIISAKLFYFKWVKINTFLFDIHNFLADKRRDSKRTIHAKGFSAFGNISAMYSLFISYSADEHQLLRPILLTFISIVICLLWNALETSIVYLWTYQENCYPSSAVKKIANRLCKAAPSW